MHSHLNYDIMKKCAKSMGIDDIRSYYRPSHGNLRLTFRSLKQELTRNRDMGSKTLLLVYFSGYGCWDNSGSAHILLNDDNAKIKHACLFPIEKYLTEISNES